MIKLIIADDNDLMRDTLARTLGRSSEIEIVAAAADAQGMLAAVETHRPDVVLMDLRLGDRWGLELVPSLLAATDSSPPPQIVVFSAVADADTAEACIRAGVFRQLAKGCPLAEVEQSIIDAATVTTPPGG